MNTNQHFTSEAGIRDQRVASGEGIERVSYAYWNFLASKGKDSTGFVEAVKYLRDLCQRAEEAEAGAEKDALVAEKEEIYRRRGHIVDLFGSLQEMDWRPILSYKCVSNGF